jgi:protein TonB
MLTTSMFGTLETTWDHSARRGWATLASFTMQAFALSSLAAISLIWVERPPQVHWLEITSPALFTPHGDTPAQTEHRAANHGANPNSGQITAPITVPTQIARINDGNSDPVAPELPTGCCGSGGGPIEGLPVGTGGNFTVAILPRPAAAKPLVISHLAEANLLHRVQPVYPTIARLGKIQGPVELRAIISKAGTIENLAVVSGHPMLVVSAKDAVRQWRYRPYLLNGEPIEVETDITVNFILSDR